MPISGLIITTDHEQPQLAADARQRLADHPAVTLGVSEGHRHAAVLDTPDAGQDKPVFEWIRSLPGVAFVDVVFVDFDSDAPSLPGQAAPQTRAHTSALPSRFAGGS